jgi:hypothetical protein
MSESRFDYDRGVRLLGSILWMDAARRDVLNFVSSARVDRAAVLQRGVCTDRTKTLLRALRPDFQALIAPFHRRLMVGPLELTMLPAGFVPGSAQLLVEGAGERFLYAAHVSLEPHRMAEEPHFVQAPTLVLRTPYGDPRFTLPSRQESLERLVEVARATIAAGRVPVFLASVVGKAQEATRALSDAGIPVAVHRSIYQVCRQYRTLGFDPGKVVRFRGGARFNEAVVWPEALRGSRAIAGLKRPTVIWLSGLAMIPDALSRMRADVGIPLTGHLGPEGLLRFVERTGARRVHTVGRWSQSFARALRQRGVEAIPLHREVQLSLFGEAG